MSLLGKQTNITQNDYFFLLANVSTLRANNIIANNISTGNLNAGIGSISSLNAHNISTSHLNTESISSQYTETNYAEISTIFVLNGFISSFVTNNIVLDGNTLDTGGAGFGSVLLLNGLPIATGSSTLSSIQDWSFFPAVSTLKMDGYNISNAGNITCQNIFNALNVQTDTLAALTSATAPSAVITNLRTNNLSTVNFVGSNATVSGGITGGSFTGGVGTFTGLSSLSVSTGTINGQPYTAGSNWSQYPAVSLVNLATFGLSNTSNLNINAARNIALSNPSGGLTNWTTSVNTGDFTVLADQGSDVTNTANLNLTAQGGTRGVVAITANAGLTNTLFGQVDITANGGNFGGIGTGGLININANTPIGLSNATSAIKMNAAGINSYAGIIPSIGSLAGYNFIYGTNGVNICAGLPAGALPNTVGTVYLYGTLGLEMPSDAYMKNIYPYWDGVTTPPDLNITGRYIIPNLAQVNVRMSNVRYIYMEQGTQALIDGVGTMNMSNGTISNANNISGTGTISGYNTVSATNVGFTTATGTTVNSGTVNANNITGSNTVSTLSMGLSSINGFASFGTKSMRVEGDVAQIQLSNNNPAGAGTILNLLSRVATSEIQSFNSNFTTPLPLFLNSAYTSTTALFCSTINGQSLPYAYGSFTVNTDQTIGVANSAVSTIFDTTEISNGISIVGGTGTQIAVSTSGVYRWLASPQFNTSSGGANPVEFWFQKNGVNIPRSASRATVANNATLFSAVEIIEKMNAQDTLQFCFTSSDTNMNLTYLPATGVVPDAPALILTGQKIADA